MKNSISIKKAFICLMELREQLPELYKDYPEYNQIVQLIQKNDYLYEDELNIPTFKELEVLLGIKTYKLRKLIDKMYLTLFDFENGPNIRFPETEYFFNVKYLGKYASVKIKELKNTPRVGEAVHIPFLKAMIGTDYMFVEAVSHTYYHNKSVIDIQLQVGSFNLFWHYKKHEAYETGRISLHDYIDKSDWGLKKQVGLSKS